MAKVCFSTVCSSNHYSYFIPTFLYSIKRAYPNVGVKVFVKGKLKDDVRECLDKLRKDKLIDGDWEVKDDYFKKFPMRVSTCNSLRFLLPKDYFAGYDYVFIRDIDFIVLPHKVSHMGHFIKRMKSVSACMFGARGPYHFPSRPEINGKGWAGKYSRVGGGLVILKSPEWFDKTKGAVKHYRTCLKSSTGDGIDKHVAGSYREYDEVMLYRICKKSHIGTPSKKGRGVDGKGVSNTYRDIHLGDFAKWGFSKIKRKISVETVRQYMLLEKDPVWQMVKEAAGKNKKVRVLLRRAKKHIRSR